MSLLASGQLMAIFLIISSLFINLSISESYKLDDNLLKVVDQTEKYNKSGWITYTTRSPSISKVEILKEGDFTFAWKTDKISNKLYINNEPLENSLKFKEHNYIHVNQNETLRFIFSTNNITGGQVWIAFPSEQANSQESNEINAPNYVFVNDRNMSLNNNSEIGFYTLQRAIDVATPGSVINISAGIYQGYLLIDKPMQLIGEPFKRGTIIDLEGKYIDIMSSDVTIKNVEIRNGDIAIRILNSSRINITNNYIINSNVGIRILDAENICCTNNLINTRNNSAILANTSYVTFKNNSLLNSKYDAIKLKNTDHSIFANNRFVYSESCDIFDADRLRYANRYVGCIKCPGQNDSGCWCCS